MDAALVPAHRDSYHARSITRLFPIEVFVRETHQAVVHKMAFKPNK